MCASEMGTTPPIEGSGQGKGWIIGGGRPVAFGGSSMSRSEAYAVSGFICPTSLCAFRMALSLGPEISLPRGHQEAIPAS